MHRHDGNTPVSPARAEPSAGYLITESDYRQLQALHDELRLLAHLSACADPQRTIDGLPVGTLVNNAQRAVQALDGVLVNARWQSSAD